MFQVGVVIRLNSRLIYKMSFRRRKKKNDEHTKDEVTFGYGPPSSRSRMMMSGDDVGPLGHDDDHDDDQNDNHLMIREAIGEYVRYLMAQFALRGNQRK